MSKLFGGICIALCMLVWASVATAQSGNYLIKPGDSLSIEVLDDDTLNRQVLVTPDGRFSFPLAGTLLAAGRTVGQVQRALASALTPNFAAPPTVFVSVTGVSPLDPVTELDDIVTVYVVGEVNAPGPKEVLPGTTVLQLLSQSGGFTQFAATKRLQLRRTEANGRQRLIEINYRAISRGAQVTNEPILREGDVLLVPERRLFE